jgi:hypothetical protein
VWRQVEGLESQNPNHTISVDEDQVEWNIRSFHPELAIDSICKPEEHAGILGQRGSVHEPALLFFGVLRNADPDRRGLGGRKSDDAGRHLVSAAGTLSLRLRLNLSRLPRLELEVGDLLRAHSRLVEQIPENPQHDDSAYSNVSRLLTRERRDRVLS